uniref:MADF domain-containing protein n=1 Tax=Caenorhabditis japonica TaxID=281687 RepID=K7HYX8_CAEJA
MTEIMKSPTYCTFIEGPSNTLFLYRNPSFLQELPFNVTSFIDAPVNRERAKYLTTMIKGAVPSSKFIEYSVRTSGINNLHYKHIMFDDLGGAIAPIHHMVLNYLDGISDVDGRILPTTEDLKKGFYENEQVDKELLQKIPESTLTLLVKKVEENPCLWEIEHTDYKDTVKKDRIWWNIEKEMKILKVVKGATVKKVWIQLVTEFKKSKARISPSGSGFGEDEEEENFGFFNQMRFLEGSLAKKTPICLPTSSSGVARRKLEVSTPKRKKVFLEEDEDTPKTRAKKEEDPEMAKLDKLIDLCTTSMENRQNATKMQEHADITTIVLDTLRTLPPSQQFELKMEIGRCCEKFKVPRYQSLNNFNLDIHTFD